MDILVSNRQQITAGLEIHRPYIIISLRDVGSPRPRIPSPRQCRGICFLAFDDVQPEDREPLPPDLHPMRPGHARRIWQFVQTHEPEIQTIVVHCEMGLSRSPAVAAALCLAFAQDDERFFLEYQPNRHVYHLMCSVIRAFAAPTSEKF